VARRFKTQHYLKGAIFCARCKSRMSLTFARGNGGIYPYFFCLGRQRVGRATNHVSRLTR
jgi:hypothetical protein